MELPVDRPRAPSGQPIKHHVAMYRLHVTMPCLQLGLCGGPAGHGSLPLLDCLGVEPRTPQVVATPQFELYLHPCRISVDVQSQVYRTGHLCSSRGPNCEGQDARWLLANSRWPDEASSGSLQGRTTVIFDEGGCWRRGEARHKAVRRACALCTVMCKYSMFVRTLTSGLRLKGGASQGGASA